MSKPFEMWVFSSVRRENRLNEFRGVRVIVNQSSSEWSNGSHLGMWCFGVKSVRGVRFFVVNTLSDSTFRPPYFPIIQFSRQVEKCYYFN